MKTNELRLNNLLEVDGVIIKVGKIEEKHITWNLSKKDNLRVWNPFLSINDNRINPVPITEEWLLKFGYIKNGSNYIIQGHSIWICNDLLICDKTGIVLKSVHQLQNLYFAKTGGKELELEVGIKKNEALNKTDVSSSVFGNLEKYFEDLQNYEDNLYCLNCGNDSKKTFNYIRTVANGEVYWCKRCKTENLVSEKPNEDNY